MFREVNLSALMVIGLSGPAHALAAFGDLDPTFVSPSIPTQRCDNSVSSTGDAILYVGTGNAYGFGVSRLRKDGSLDTAWGTNGNVALPTPSNSSASIFVVPSGFLPLPDGGVIVVGQYLVKITRAGAIDTSYGNHGVSDELRDGGEGSGFIESHALQPDGSVVVLTRGSNGGSLAAFTRINAQGKRDATFGTNGVLNLPFDVPVVYGWSVQPNGVVEYGIYSRGGSVIEPRLRRLPVFLSQGDFGFDPHGRLVPAAGAATWLSPNVQALPDGGVLIAASTCTGLQCLHPSVAISKFKGDGTPDAAYGVGGRQYVSPYTTAPYINTSVWPHMLSLGPEGKVTAIVHGEYSSGGFFPSDFDSAHRAFRLTPDGTVDPSFANGRTLPSWQFTRVLQIDDGRLLVTAEGGCMKRLETDAVRMNVPVAEFYQPQVDRYFITAVGMEAGTLDADDNPSTRWHRTGYNFGAWLPFDLPGAKRVCRFYGDSVAGPHSHFYTLEGAECDGLRALEAATPLGQAAWRFEGYAFNAIEPVGGACPANLTPVYRNYNMGFEHGRAPNHRYTVDAAVYEAMIAKGWAPEGVKFCVPPASSNVGTYGY